MGLLGKLIAGKVMGKAVQKLNQRSATAAAQRARHGQYIPAGTVAPSVRSGVAGKALDFYEKNPKLVAGAATLVMAAIAASLSKGSKLR